MKPFTINELRAAAHDIYRGGRIAAGFDGLCPAELNADRNRANELHAQIARHLNAGDYKFGRGKKGRIPREGKAPREHCIGSMQDAIALKAIAKRLSPAWKRIPTSIRGGRPGESCPTVIAEITSAISRGSVFAAKFDLQAAFASAPFDRALEALALLTDGGEEIAHLKRWRTAQGAKFPGLVEGSAVATLLLAALLGQLADELSELEGVSFWLWVDDGLILAPTPELRDQALEVARAHAQELGMNLHPDKTKTFLVDISDDKTVTPEFLGVVWRAGRPEPSEASCSHLLAAIEDRVAERRFDEIGSLIAAWHSYFDLEVLELFRALDRVILARTGFVWIPIVRLMDLARESNARRGSSPQARGGIFTGKRKVYRWSHSSSRGIQARITMRRRLQKGSKKKVTTEGRRNLSFETPHGEKNRFQPPERHAARNSEHSWSGSDDVRSDTPKLPLLPGRGHLDKEK